MVFDLAAESLAIFRGLESAGIRSAGAGAFAVALHEAPRATTDIDLLRARGARRRAGGRGREEPSAGGVVHA